MSYILQANKTDTLAAELAVGATSATLTSGNFGSPSGLQVLTLAYNNSAKLEIITCNIAGTALTDITRGVDSTTDVLHASGTQVTMAFTPSHHEALKSGADIADSAITPRKIDSILTTSDTGSTSINAGGSSAWTDVTTATMDVTVDVTSTIYCYVEGNIQNNSTFCTVGFRAYIASPEVVGTSVRGTVQLTANSIAFTGISILQSVTAGTHTIKMQFNSNFTSTFTSSNAGGNRLRVIAIQSEA